MLEQEKEQKEFNDAALEAIIEMFHKIPEGEDVLRHSRDYIYNQLKEKNIPNTVSYIEAFAEEFSQCYAFWLRSGKTPEIFEQTACIAAGGIVSVAREERKAYSTKRDLLEKQGVTVPEE